MSIRGSRLGAARPRVAKKTGIRVSFIIGENETGFSNDEDVTFDAESREDDGMDNDL